MADPETSPPPAVERIRRPVGVALVLVCAASSVTWWFVVPAEAETASGLHAVVLRAGHSAVWTLLAIAALLWTLGASPRTVGRAAAPALAVYALFVVATVL
jgi:hypothetical protein